MNLFSVVLKDRDELAGWMLSTLRQAPALHHGGGRYLLPSDKESLIDEAVGEFLELKENGCMPQLDILTRGIAIEQAESDLRFALWNRVSELITQECENRDPEYAHAKRRLESFIALDLPLTGCIHFTLLHVHYIASTIGLEQRHLPICPRVELEKAIVIPELALKYGDGLSGFITETLSTLEYEGFYRPWLSVDDLAYMLGRAEEHANTKDWMTEQIANSLENSVLDLQSAITVSAAIVLLWYEDEYAVKKQFQPPVREILREAFSDHIHQLIHDPGNHPGLQALLLHHLPIEVEVYRKLPIRSDFEYMIRRFRNELRLRLRRLDM